MSDDRAKAQQKTVAAGGGPAAGVEQRLATVLEHTADAFLALDRDGRITYANPQAADIGSTSSSATIAPRRAATGARAWDWGSTSRASWSRPTAGASGWRARSAGAARFLQPAGVRAVRRSGSWRPEPGRGRASVGALPGRGELWLGDAPHLALKASRR